MEEREALAPEALGTRWEMVIQTPAALANQIVRAGEGAKITPDMVKSAQNILNANDAQEAGD
ncbi:hypothetical protein [Streptomyces sp. NPDC003006]